MEAARMNRLWNLHPCLRHPSVLVEEGKVCRQYQVNENQVVYLYPDFRQNNQNPVCPLENKFVLNECFPSCLNLKNGFAAWYFYSFLQKKGRLEYKNNNLFWIVTLWAFIIELLSLMSSEIMSFASLSVLCQDYTHYKSFSFFLPVSCLTVNRLFSPGVSFRSPYWGTWASSPQIDTVTVAKSN